MAYTLDELVRQSDRLVLDIGEDCDIPRITRTLEQMKNLGENMQISRDSKTEVNAARLLGSKMSYDLPTTLTTKLKQISSTTIDIEPEQNVKLDLPSFLNNQREYALSYSINKCLKKVDDDVNEKIKKNSVDWWSDELLSILSSINRITLPNLPGNVFNQFVDKKNNLMIKAKHRKLEYQSLTRQELCYAENLEQYIDALTTANFSVNKNFVIDSFASIVNSENESMYRFGPQRPPLFDCWNLMMGFFKIEVGDDITFPQNGSSISSIINARCSKKLQRFFINRALAYLEFEYEQFILFFIESSKGFTCDDGSMRRVIQAYINNSILKGDSCYKENDWSINNESGTMKSNQTYSSEYEDGMVNGCPLWIMIFYCLRCGALEDAVEIAFEASSIIGNNFPTCLNAYVSNYNRQLDSEMIERLSQEYRRSIRNSRDVYKKACWSLLSRIDVSSDAQINSLFTTIDDFLWFHLFQAIPNQDLTRDLNGKSGTQFDSSLTALQNLMHETYDEDHFNAINQPMTYFKVLFLTQQFEAAIAFLSRFSDPRSGDSMANVAQNHSQYQSFLQTSNIDMTHNEVGGAGNHAGGNKGCHSDLISHSIYIAICLQQLNLLVTTLPLELTLDNDETDEFSKIDPKAKKISLLSRDDATDPVGIYHLNLSRLILTYTEKFQLHSPLLALNYYIFIHLCNFPSYIESKLTSGKKSLSISKMNVFIHSLIELVLQTGEFDSILGAMSNSNSRKPGKIDKICQVFQKVVSSYQNMPTNSKFLISPSVNQIINLIAAELDNRGLSLDAIRVYLRLSPTSPSNSSDWAITSTGLKRALELMNNIISSTIANSNIPKTVSEPLNESLNESTMSRTSPNKDQNYVIGERLLKRIEQLSSDGYDIDEMHEDIVSLKKLLEICTFIQMTQRGYFQNALNLLKTIDILPLKSAEMVESSMNTVPSDLLSEIDAKDLAFSKMPEPLKRTISSLLLATLYCLIGLKKNLVTSGNPIKSDSFFFNTSTSGSSDSQNNMKKIRMISKALISFATRIDYTLSNNLYSKLSQLENELK